MLENFVLIFSRIQNSWTPCHIRYHHGIDRDITYKSDQHELDAQRIYEPIIKFHRNCFTLIYMLMSQHTIILSTFALTCVTLWLKQICTFWKKIKMIFHVIISVISNKWHHVLFQWQRVNGGIIVHNKGNLPLCCNVFFLNSQKSIKYIMSQCLFLSSQFPPFCFCT